MSASGSEGLVQVLIYLFLLLAIVAGGLFFMRNGFAMFQRGNKVDRKLNISETRMLGNRQFLVVAEYEDRKMLIGVCPGRIDYLCTLAGKSDDAFSTVLPEKPE